jgi:hypothetical protein
MGLMKFVSSLFMKSRDNKVESEILSIKKDILKDRWKVTTEIMIDGKKYIKSFIIKSPVKPTHNSLKQKTDKISINILSKKNDDKKKNRDLFLSKFAKKGK